MGIGMFRTALIYLEKNWIAESDRKPLVIRGARQVGKTWLVREFSKVIKKQLIEINFERDIQIRSLFETNDPKAILQNLEIYLGKKIDPSTSLLFLDEIQDAPEVFAKLRWFYEEMPELPVIAAGSLLEFILQTQSVSMPVGRVTYLHLEPLSFEEFLRAQDTEIILASYIENMTPPWSIPLAIHQKLHDQFRKYLQVGGMPAVVASWIKKRSMEPVVTLQQDLLAAYRDDFFKYKGRIDVQKLDTLLKAVPAQLGQKFVFSKADQSIQTSTAKQILSLFNKARLCHIVQSSAGNAIPLAAEVKDKAFKQIFLDVGLVNRFLGDDLSFARMTTEGGVSEQIVGQMLRCLFPFYIEPSLYYWQREEKGSNAEIDYLIEYKKNIIPIEVKSGNTGSLKSLHLFMEMKQFPLAIRINSELPSVHHVQVKGVKKEEVSYTLLSIPFYLTGQIYRLLDHLNVRR